MRRYRTFALLVLGFIFATLAGLWIGNSTKQKNAPLVKAVPPPEVKLSDLPDAEWNTKSSTARKPGFRLDQAAMDAGAIPGQRSLRFASAEALENFLKNAGDKIRVLGRMDRLNALRVGFLDHDFLSSLLDGTEDQDYIYPAYTPDPQGGSAQSDAVPLSNGLLKWLGVEGSDPAWGAGIKIAILDTGSQAHPAYGDITNINMVALPENMADFNGHGTAVASLILGQLLEIPGAAPGATALAYRIANDLGQSDTWMLAQAIYDATDAGVSIINVSMGSYGDSRILSEAVTYALNKGVALVASAGNDGYTYNAYPAAYDGVLKALAVDAANSHLLFSNQLSSSTGDTTNTLPSGGYSAPGWQVNAAYPNDKVTSFSGTSASAPIISGLLATIMTHGSANGTPLTAHQALAVLSNYVNDTDAGGYDSKTGAGTVNLARILQADNSNITDAAIASNYIIPPTSSTAAKVQINVQNRGTASLRNVPVTVKTPNGTTTLTVSSLAPNATQSFWLDLPASAFANNAPVSVTSQIQSSDAVPSNNKKTNTYTPSQEP